VVNKAGILSCNNSTSDKVPEDSLKEYLTISELTSLCNLPGKGGEKLPCEGKEVKVRAYVDFINVFDKEHYPQLPYEKFLIYDSSKTNILDVFTISDDNYRIFKKVYKNNVKPQRMIFINAIIEGVDTPTNYANKRWIRLNIDDEEDIFFVNH